MKVGLVGCGRIAQKYAKLFSPPSEIPGAELVAVCDIQSSRSVRLGETYGVKHYSSMREMFDSNDINIACILTESGYHANNTIIAADYVENIIVEKPMALTLPDADRMIRKCEKTNTRLFVVKQNRFNVPVVKLREALVSRRFGRLVLGTVRVRWCRTQDYYNQDPWRGTWAMDGGVLTNQASHHIDLLEWMMGDVESVAAMSTTALVNIETEDTAMAILKFRSGAMGIVEATTAARPTDLEGSLSILGERGTVVIGGFAVNQMLTWSFENEFPGDSEVIERYSVNPPDVYGFGHVAYLTHVMDCIEKDQPALVDGLEGKKSLELITAIYEAIEEKKTVNLAFSPSLCKLGR